MKLFSLTITITTTGNRSLSELLITPLNPKPLYESFRDPEFKKMRNSKGSYCKGERPKSWIERFGLRYTSVAKRKTPVNLASTVWGFGFRVLEKAQGVSS